MNRARQASRKDSASGEIKEKRKREREEKIEEVIGKVKQTTHFFHSSKREKRDM